jgi:uncharacterized protein (TIGR02117 family)
MLLYNPRGLARAGLAILLLLVAFSPARSEWKCLPEAHGCKSLYVVHDTWHAAIVLRVADISTAALPEILDFSTAEFVEFSWGDKDYFPNPNAGVFTALKAAFWSSGSVLHVVGFSKEVKVFYPVSTVTEVRITTSSFDQLINFISKTFYRQEPGARSQPSAGLFAYSRFYPSTHRFSLLKTCNTWVAEALESAGLPVAPGQVLTAANLETQITGLGEAR